MSNDIKDLFAISDLVYTSPKVDGKTYVIEYSPLPMAYSLFTKELVTKSARQDDQYDVAKSVVDFIAAQERQGIPPEDRKEGQKDFFDKLRKEKASMLLMDKLPELKTMALQMCLNRVTVITKDAAGSVSQQTIEADKVPLVVAGTRINVVSDNWLDKYTRLPGLADALMRVAELLAIKTDLSKAEKKRLKDPLLQISTPKELDGNAHKMESVAH